MTPRRRSPLILVVEDDSTTNQMIQGILARSGFETAGAFTVAEALANVRQLQPDLVLLDLKLPDGNGLDVCREIQGMSGVAQAPVLFISSNDDVVSKVQGFEAGGVDYIPKPLAGEEVIARVRTHLRLKQAYETLSVLHAERIQRLAVAQEMLMPQPNDHPSARFQICLRQVLKAGGDFYDVIPVSKQITDYIVADASGHDLSASFWTAALKTLLAEYARPTNSPMEALRSINSTLCRVLPSGVFFTLAYARLNRQTGKLSLANAGHPPALHLSRDGGSTAVIRQDGDVLGAFPDAGFNVKELKLKPGDRFYLFSDGLIELRIDREDGLRRLMSCIENSRSSSLATQVQSVVRDLTLNLAAQDDIVFMGVEV